MKDIRQITFELTNRCNLRCRICNIWSETPKKDLSLKSIKKLTALLEKPFTASITGGEAFLHPEIDAIYRHFFKLHLEKRIDHIDISTNAYSPKISEFLKTNKTRLWPLSVSISIDGMGQRHNQQRNMPDAFNKTIRNVALIKEYNIPVALKFVITNINYRDLPKVYLFSKEIQAPLYIKLYEELPSYYHRHGKIPKLSLNNEQTEKVRECIALIYKKESSKEHSTSISSLFDIKRFLDTGNLNFIKKCLCPKHSLFITASGDIYNCLYQENIGNIKNCKNLDWDKYGAIARKAAVGECPKCLSYHGYFKGLRLPK